MRVKLLRWRREPGVGGDYFLTVRVIRRKWFFWTTEAVDTYCAYHTVWRDFGTGAYVDHPLSTILSEYRSLIEWGRCNDLKEKSEDPKP